MTRPAKNMDENAIGILKRLSRRVEEAVVDIHDIKRDVKLVKMRLDTVETNTEITKIDVENIKNNINDLIENSSEILAKMVTQKEFENLSRRVTSVERVIKAA